MKLSSLFTAVILLLCFSIGKIHGGTTVASTNAETTATTLMDENASSTTTATTTATTMQDTETTTIASTETESTTPADSVTTVQATETTGNMETTDSPQVFNVTSIIEEIGNSETIRSAIDKYNVSIDMLFMKVRDYSNARSNDTVDEFLNSTAGQLLLELIDFDSAVILGNYESGLATRRRQVFFYATLLDFEDNIGDDTFVAMFVNQVILGNENVTYVPSASSLLARACVAYQNAGGTHSGCENITPTPQARSHNIGLIIGCAVAGGVLLIAVVVGSCYYCKKVLPKSKVTPSQTDLELCNSDFIERDISNSQASMNNGNVDSET